MKIAKIARGVAGGVAALALSVGVAFAQSPALAETWVSGTVYGADGNPVSGGSVSVNCGGVVKSGTIGAAGMYAVVFNQEECSSGDTASATANTSEGSGSSSTSVTDTAINGPVVDLDIAVIDITVPELGVIGAGLTGLASVGGYLALRLKKLV